MPRTTEQKIKLLVLYDLLCKYTDEDHALTTGEIIEKLKEKGIEVSRKILPGDIALLNQYGYEVLTTKGRSNGYYVVSHPFDTAEVAMFSDAIKASKLTEGHKARLLQKLGETVGEHQAENIEQNLIFYDMPRRSNSNILYSIDAISEAINARKKISFKYYSLDEHKNKVYRKEGQRYLVNPLVMTWNKDNYYLVVYHDTHDGTTNYRIDHMDDVRIEEVPITEREEYVDFNIEEYRKQEFSMFGGDAVDVELAFTRELIDGMYDKFGEEIEILPAENDTFRSTVRIQVSRTFYGWVAGTCGNVHILSPATVVDSFREYVDSIVEAYCERDES